MMVSSLSVMDNDDDDGDAVFSLCSMTVRSLSIMDDDDSVGGGDDDGGGGGGGGGDGDGNNGSGGDNGDDGDNNDAVYVQAVCAIMVSLLWVIADDDEDVDGDDNYDDDYR